MKKETRKALVKAAKEANKPIKPVKPFGNRALIQIEKKYRFEGKTPVLDEYGNHSFEPSQAAKVIFSNIEGIKKGDIVFPIIRGGVPIYHLDNKKNFSIIVDSDDIYGVEY